MYITRYNLKTQIKRANNFFFQQSKLGKNSQIYKASLKICRNKITIKYKNRFY